MHFTLGVALFFVGYWIGYGVRAFGWPRPKWRAPGEAVRPGDYFRFQRGEATALVTYTKPHRSLVFWMYGPLGPRPTKKGDK